MGTKVGDDLPDAGVVANRYYAVLLSATTGCSASCRGTPCRASTRTSPTRSSRVCGTHEADGRACRATRPLVRGKVWEAGKPEPKEWTLEVRTRSATRNGAPALYANATGIEPPKPGTEVFFRNVLGDAEQGDHNAEREENFANPREAVRSRPGAAPSAPVPSVVECYAIPRRGLFAGCAVN